MSDFDTEKVQTQRKAFTLVELHLDKNDPALDATFALQADSFGTPKTTDNPNAFTGVDFRIYRYADQQLFGVDHFPYLLNAKTKPPRIDPGKSIGFRATGSIELLDFDDGDQFSLPAPYDDRRVEGSHALKLEARNHFRNRRAKIIRGFNPFNYSESNAQVENYVIDSFVQPNEQGSWFVNVVDELILTETKKSQAPEVSSGELSADINDVVGSLSFTSPVTDEYGAVSATGHIVIEDEIMAYTVLTTTTMAITRAQFGTEPSDHKTGETIQICIVFEDVNIIDIITQLITDHTKIPTSYIPVADWAALKLGDLANYNLTRALFKPTEIKALLNELIVLAGLSMFVDVIDQELVIVTIPDFASPVIVFDQTEHLELGSVRVKPDNRKQITRQTIHWDKSNTTESDDVKNYTKHLQVADGIVEGAADEDVVSEAKAVFSNWLVNSLEDNLLATSTIQRNINRFSKTPLDVKFTVDQRYIDNVDGGRMWLGSIFSIKTDKIIDGGVNQIETTCQCVQLSPSTKDQKWDVTGLSYVAAVPPDADLYIDVDKTDYLLTDELSTTEAREYVVVINSGVTICASLTSIFAFDQGSFFAGATLKLIILGRIVGIGGKGGVGATAGPTGPTCTIGTPGNGFDGGDALNLTTNTTIDNGFGLIAAGGGGGAGNLGTCVDDPEPSLDIAAGGKGGGGAQGCLDSDGGDGGVGSTSNGPTGVPGTIAAPGDNGGPLGEDGGDVAAATGGLSGVAIQKNGNTVVITAGNNSEQIKGDVI